MKSIRTGHQVQVNKDISRKEQELYAVARANIPTVWKAKTWT